MRQYLIWLSLVCMVLLEACGAASQPQMTTGNNRTAVPAPTPSPLPALALKWQNQPLPSGGVFAPSDGDTAYGCDQADGTNYVTVWITHSHGAQVRHVAVPSVEYGQCEMVVDDTDADIVVLRIAQGYQQGGARQPEGIASAPGFSEIYDDVSFDGGLTWRTVPNGIFISELATNGTTTYGLIGTSKAPAPLLAVTHNDMATWQRIHPPNDLLRRTQAALMRHGAPLSAFRPQAINTNPQEIWLGPTSQDILFFSFVPNGNDWTLALTHDGGKTWTAQIPVPATLQYFQAQPIIGNAAWLACGATFVGNGGIQCSRDAGKTWTALPPLPTPTYLAGITPTGDIVASTGPADNQVWRLTPGAQQWQSLGPAPGAAEYYSTATGPGLLWVQYSAPSAAFPGRGPYLALYP